MPVERSLLKNITTALMYEEERCFYHDLDPRAKLFYATAVLVMVSAGSIVKLLAALGFVLALTSPCPRVFKKALHVLTGLAPFVALTALFIILFTMAFSGGGIWETLLEQFKVFTRVVIVVLAVTAIALSTTPYELVQALTSLGFRYAHLYALVIAVRFIPTILTEVGDIFDAQRSRGLELEKGSIIERIRKFNAILIPAFVCSLLRARDLAEALELRAFGYSTKRTFYKPLKLKKRDLLFITLAISSALAVHLLIP
jgi:energy-coupling factor transport system permease protein